MATWYNRVKVGESLVYGVYAARLTLGGPDTGGLVSIEAAHFAPQTGWSAPTTLAPVVFPDEISGTMDASGNGTIVWRSSDDSHVWAARYAPGVGWEAPERISTDYAGFTGSAVGAGGEVIAVWYGSDGVVANLYW